jgi:tetratricopeptide (TPR) repeat protein
MQKFCPGWSPLTTNMFSTCVILVSGSLFGILFASGPALSDSREDCDRTINREMDFNQKIAGCSELIAQGGGDQAKLVTAYIGRGLAFMNKPYEQGNTDKAEADFSKAIEIDPQQAGAYRYRGEISFDSLIPGKAIADFDRSIALDPNDATVYVLRGRAYEMRYVMQHDTRDVDRAIADFTKAVEIDPKDALAYAFRGFVRSETGEYDRAVEDESRSIELKADDPYPYQLRAKAYLMSGKVALALSDVDQLAALSPNDHYNFDFRGSIFESLGRREEAIADYRRALTLNPNMQSSKDALRRLGANEVKPQPMQDTSQPLKQIFEQMRRTEKHE